MNAAYTIAIIALALALLLGYLGLSIVTDNDLTHHGREQGAWLLVPACALLLAAIIFAGVGVDLQYT